MKKLTLTAAGAALIVSSAALAGAANDTRWYLSPNIGYVITDSDRDPLNDGAELDLRFGRAVSENFNFELSLFGGQLNNDAPNSDDVGQFGFGADFLWVPVRGGFSPYGLIGAGGMWTQVKGNGNPDSEVNPFADVGIGALWRLSAGGTALRTEARYRTEYDDDLIAGQDKFGDWIVSVGLNVPLGSVAAPAPVLPADSDNDGVIDANDRCPNTPAGAFVDAYGCELDSDADGVVDSRDACPNTPAGTPVNANGCPADSDNDGIVDSADRCPNTAPGTRVDSSGCDLAPVVRLDGVNFELNSSVLRPEARATLVDAAGTLKRYPELEVEIAGHTDSTGDAAYNQNLSQKRADRVKEYLVNEGVSRNRMTARGYGESQPVASNATREGRAQNRRVELRTKN